MPTLNGTVDQKFEDMQTILRRLARRVHKTVIGVMPAIPVMGHCETPINGRICKLLIPGSCKLKSMDLHTPYVLKNDDGEVIPFLFNIKAERKGKTVIDHFRQEDTDNPLQVDIELQGGDIFTIDTPQAVTDISYTLLFDFGDELMIKQMFILNG